MSVNVYVGHIAYDQLRKNDLDLYDAILEGDERTIKSLIKRKYWKRIATKEGLIKEPIRISVMVETIECLLNTKHINVRLV